MEDVFSVLIIGLSVGGMYALLALGLALVFGILGFINFAHGELIAITGYATYFLIMSGMPFILVLVFAVLSAMIGAMAIERIAFRPIRNAYLTTGILTSFGLEMIIQSSWSNLISPLRLPIKRPDWLIQFWEIGDSGFSTYQGLAIVLTLISLIALSLFLKKTTMGLSMQAAAADFPVAQLMGIRANRVIATAFAISGLLAGIAAFLWIAQRGSCDPFMGFNPLIKAFIALVFGGMSRLSGAVIGGILIGFIEVGLRTYLPDSAVQFQEPIAYFIVIIILMRWPDGLISVFRKQE